MPVTQASLTAISHPDRVLLPDASQGSPAYPKHTTLNTSAAESPLWPMGPEYGTTLNSPMTK